MTEDLPKSPQVQFNAHNGNQNWVPAVTCGTAQKPGQSRSLPILAHRNALPLLTNMSEALSPTLLPA